MRERTPTIIPISSDLESDLESELDEFAAFPSLVGVEEAVDEVKLGGGVVETRVSKVDEEGGVEVEEGNSCC